MFCSFKKKKKKNYINVLLISETISEFILVSPFSSIKIPNTFKHNLIATKKEKIKKKRTFLEPENYLICKFFL